MRSAEDFECKRAKVRVTQVQDGIFVARGCGQEGAYRCEMGIEGGCRRLRGAPADKLIELAPEGEGEGDDEDEAPKKKKKKKPAPDDDAATTEASGGKDAGKKSDSEKGGSEKKSGADDPPPEKKKKKKQSDE